MSQNQYFKLVAVSYKRVLLGVPPLWWWCWNFYRTHIKGAIALSGNVQEMIFYKQPNLFSETLVTQSVTLVKKQHGKDPKDRNFSIIFSPEESCDCETGGTAVFL